MKPWIPSVIRYALLLSIFAWVACLAITIGYLSSVFQRLAIPKAPQRIAGNPGIPLTARTKWIPTDFFSDETNLVLCHKMSENGDEFEKLLQQGVPLNMAEKFGFTPLTWAYATGRFDRVKQLLAYGAKPDFPIAKSFVDTDLIKGDTLVMTATRSTYGRPILINLIDATDQPNQRDLYGKSILVNYVHATPLVPVRELDLVVVQHLLNRGFDVNAPHPPNGASDLVSCAHWYRLEICLALLEAGADPTYQDQHGISFIDQINSLIAGERLDDFLRPPTRAELQATIDWLSQHGFQVNDP